MGSGHTVVVKLFAGFSYIVKIDHKELSVGIEHHIVWLDIVIDEVVLVELMTHLEHLLAELHHDVLRDLSSLVV